MNRFSLRAVLRSVIARMRVSSPVRISFRDRLDGAIATAEPVSLRIRAIERGIDCERNDFNMAAGASEAPAQQRR